MNIPRSKLSFSPLVSRLGRGFTLVEVLVVIGIMALLIAILMPALSAAREQAKSIQCLSNLRQMGIAVKIYANQYNGYFPIAQYSAANAWDFQVMSNPLTGEQRVIPGILWQGQGDIRIQQCPSCEITSPTVSDPYTGYNYNTSFVGHGIGEFRTSPAKVNQLRRPTETAVFGDGQYWGGTNKFMRAPIRQNPPDTGDIVSSSMRSAGTQGYRHRGRTNVCYADGHADSVGERYATTSPPQAYIAPGTGFLSSDNRAYSGQP